VIGSAVVLAGCGGSDDSGSDALEAAQAQASAISSVTGSTPPATGEEPAAGGSGAVSADEFCAAVQAAQPKLNDQSDQSDTAFITLTIEIANLYGEKNAQSEMNGSAMDELAKSCPDIAAKALKSAGKNSFSEF
jgi:hypothetical protein